MSADGSARGSVDRAEITLSMSSASTPLPHLKSSATTVQISAFPSSDVSNSSTCAKKPISITCASTTTTTLQTAPATDRVFNFTAGPTILPQKVLLKAQSELYNCRGSGMSVMEMSHHGKEFMSIIEKAELDLRSLLNILPEYTVLFLQGGTTTQFAAVPLNLCKPNDIVDYVVTGSWSDKALKEASKYCNPKSIWSGKFDKYTKISTLMPTLSADPSVDPSADPSAYASADPSVYTLADHSAYTLADPY